MADMYGSAYNCGNVWVAIEELLLYELADDDKFHISFLRGKKDKPMLVIWSYVLVVGFSLQMDWLAGVIINIEYWLPFLRGSNKISYFSLLIAIR